MSDTNRELDFSQSPNSTFQVDNIALGPEDQKLINDTWQLATFQGPSVYLSSKGINSVGISVTNAGALLIPMADASGKIKNLQRLEIPKPDGSTIGPQQSFSIKNQNVGGLRHVLGKIEPGKPVVFTANYVDAASIHQSTGLPVAVTFNDKNTPFVADLYLSKPLEAPSKLIFHVTSTNDNTDGPNPFIEMYARSDVSILPAGGEHRIEGFEGFEGKSINDLMQQFGESAVKSLIDQAITNGVKPDYAQPAPAQPSPEPTVNWQSPWLPADDGLSSVRHVVGASQDGSTYFAGSQKMTRSVESPIQWDQEAFIDEAKATLRSRLLANKALEALSPPKAQPKNQSSIEKIQADDVPLASNVDETLSRLKSQYLLAENKFYFRDNTKTLAFQDAGKTISSDLDSPQIIRSMLELSASKGWSAIKLNGTDVFKRRAWVEAQTMGLKTQGYEPDDFDRNELAQRLATAAIDSSLRNTITPAEAPTLNQQNSPAEQTTNAKAGNPQPSVSDEPQNDLAERYGTRLARDLQKALSRKGFDPSSSQTGDALDYVAGLATSPRVFVGKLIDHGVAPYEFNETATSSYYAKLQTEYGEKIIWGVDIPRALSTSGGAAISKGDEILLAFQGSKPVSVYNELTGETVQTHRNTWYAEKVSDLPGIAQAKSERPTYSTFGEGAPKTGLTQLNGKQAMLAGVLQSKGAPDAVIQKALTASVQLAQTAPIKTAITARPSL